MSELKEMVRSFRVHELQSLLGLAGKLKTGRKHELQQRMFDLLRNKSFANSSLPMKIRRMYETNAKKTRSTNEENTVIPMGFALPSDLSVTYPCPPVFPQYPIQEKHSESFPVQSDVTFKRLPFYDLVAVLVPPTTLAPSVAHTEHTSSFFLTYYQSSVIMSSRDVNGADYQVQIHARFCLNETSCEQEDSFPPGLVLKVNGKVCSLPQSIVNPTNKQPAQHKKLTPPLNITSFVKLSPTMPNFITINWEPDNQTHTSYCVSVSIVKRLSSGELLSRLKIKGPRLPDFTRGLIKEKLSEDPDSEIATTCLRVSLLCPLGKMKMRIPCRSSTCFHLQCFDAALFLQMNEKKPTWLCPVCDKTILFDNLVIDGYFQEVLNSASLLDCHDIQLHQDGSWSSSASRRPVASTVSSTIEISLDSDGDEKPEKKIDIVKVEEASGKAKKDKVEVIDLTVSSSESEGSDTESNTREPWPPFSLKTKKDSDEQSTDSGPSTATILVCDESPQEIIMLDSSSPTRFADELASPLSPDEGPSPMDFHSIFSDFPPLP